MEETKEYIKEYNQFLKDYQTGITDGIKVGELISRLGSYYTNANLEHASALINFNIKAKNIETQVDENSGKSISSSKAKVLADATMEAQTLIMAKANLENIEVIINCAKSLQRGLMQDKNFAGL